MKPKPSKSNKYVCENCGNAFSCRIHDEPHLHVKFCPVCGENSDFENVETEYEPFEEEDEDCED